MAGSGRTLGTYYGAGIAGLCWRENQFDITLRTGAVGSPIGISGTIPQPITLQYKSELTNGPAKSGDLAYPYLPAYGSKVMYLRGTYAVDQTKKRVAAAIPDPAFDAALRLTDTLKSIGISVSSDPQSSMMLADKGQTIPAATKASPPFYRPS
jgi:D-alanyl-D-alanine carboxypeptidase/D-alanyl-D-alanine-endopeptidase (penicillin-binding protein 4)